MELIWKVKVKRDSTPHTKDLAGMRMLWVWRGGKEGPTGGIFMVSSDLVD